jgi:hypothetical protein
MSTRCNILIKSEGADIYLYHHCDGYPTLCGVGTQLRILASAGAFTQMTRGANHLVKGNFERFAKKVNVSPELFRQCDYEITDMEHGDIEYLYTVSFDEFWGALRIECTEIDKDFSEDGGLEEKRNMVFVTLYKNEDLKREMLVKGSTDDDIRPIAELLETYKVE